MLKPEQADFLLSDEREIRLYLSYAEANVVRTKVAQVLLDRAVVSRLKSITGGWAFTIQGDDRGAVGTVTSISSSDSSILDTTSDMT